MQGKFTSTSLVGKVGLRLALLAAAVIGTLVVGEVLCRLLFPAPVEPSSDSPTGNQYVYYKYDPLLGWANAPNMRGTFKRSEFEFPISINAFGMRDREVQVAKCSSEVRIAFLGDSFTWGIGASDTERYTDLLNEDPGIEALNFGVSGYGPVHYLPQLDKVLRLHPDLVMVIFCCNNDFRDNVQSMCGRYYKPYCVLSQTGELEIKGFPIPDCRRFGIKSAPAGLAGMSVLWRKSQSAVQRATMEIFAPRMAGLTDFDTVYDYDQMDRQQQRVVEEAIEINRQILKRIKQRLNAESIPIVLVTAPSKMEFRFDQGYDDSVGRILQKTADELQIDFVNTIPMLNKSDFWARDGHWKPSGHRKMAAAIREYLTSKQFLAARQLSSDLR